MHTGTEHKTWSCLAGTTPIQQRHPSSFKILLTWSENSYKKGSIPYK